MGSAREDANATTFDAWARAGRGERMAAGHTPLVDHVLDRWTLGSDSHVLDVGCGVGEALAAARLRGAGAVAGVDVSPEMITQAQAKHPDGDLHVASAARLPFDDRTFTHALSIESLYYHDDPVASLREVRRVLAPGAPFAMAIELYRENPGAHGWVEAMDVPLHLWDTDRWVTAFLEGGFREVDQGRIVRPEPVPDEATWEGSAYFPSYEAYATYLREGALWVQGVR